MSEPRLELGSAANWRSVYQQMHRANPSRRRGYIPITPIQIPILFESHILAAAGDSEFAREHWWLGYRLKMMIDVPGTDFLDVAGHEVNIPVNRGGKLIQLPKLAPQFRLIAEVPYWHEEMLITIYEYIGTYSDSTEALIEDRTDQIRIDIARLEQRLN
ncbi:MAG: hypothetical protein F6K28_15745 [Microcoleus sp. SIO2G3]|nr:hypothetical protein [Microcoleus sp. SIO2G3]